MPQTPSQEQINALLQEARRSASAVQVSADATNVSAFDLRQSKQISESGTRGVSAIQEAFARRLTESFSSYLHAAFEAKLASVEQKSLADFAKELQSPAYLASIRFPSLGASALLLVDLPLALQMLDLMLGGDGKEQGERRDLTDIEQEIFESAGRLLCEELRLAWQPALDTEIRFEARVQIDGCASLMPASEKLMLTAFDITLAENTGKLTLAIPGAVSTALTREAAPALVPSVPANSQKNRARLQELLGNCAFDTELTLPPSPVSVREVFDLQPGSIVVLGVRASEPIQLNVAGKNMFTAVPVGCGSQRGAQIERVLSIAPEKNGK
ncbi:MAG TPA: FliM/FliN family flagellar motor switch protein [Verrucomicrobiae bacterium]|nr:FliM/FliN family flagellar motor switch protein [Verrucomicrobiae bacterium]